MKAQEMTPIPAGANPFHHDFFHMDLMVGEPAHHARIMDAVKESPVKLTGTPFDGEYATLDDAVARAVEYMAIEREAVDCPYILVKDGDFGNIAQDGVIMAWREVLLSGKEPFTLSDARLGARYITITEA